MLFWYVHHCNRCLPVVMASFAVLPPQNSQFRSHLYIEHPQTRNDKCCPLCIKFGGHSKDDHIFITAQLVGSWAFLRLFWIMCMYLFYVRFGFPHYWWCIFIEGWELANATHLSSRQRSSNSASRQEPRSCLVTGRLSVNLPAIYNIPWIYISSLIG